MTFSIRHRKDFKEMMKTAAAANMGYAKKEMCIPIKEVMKKRSKKLKEWNKDQPE